MHHEQQTSSDTDDLFQELYQTTDELRQASRAIDTAYDRLQSLRDSLISFAARTDRVQSRQRLSPGSEREHNDGLANNTPRLLHQNTLEVPSPNAVPSLRRRRSIHPSSNSPNAAGNSASIHTRRSMLESHLRSIRRLLNSTSSLESTTSLGRRVIQRITDSADSDQSNEDNSPSEFSPPPSRVESRAAAAHLRLSFLPNPTARSTTNRNVSSLTRTRTTRSNSLTALPRPLYSSNTNVPSSQSSFHTPGRLSRENESTTRMFDEFVRTYWPQRQHLESSDTITTSNTFASDSEDVEIDNRLWASTRTPDINDIATSGSVLGADMQPTLHSTGVYGSIVNGKFHRNHLQTHPIPMAMISLVITVLILTLVQGVHFLGLLSVSLLNHIDRALRRPK